MDLSLGHIIEGGVLAAFVAVIGLILNQKSALVRIETLLTGANGDNGLVGDMKQVRERTHKQGDELHALIGKFDLHDLRLDGLERRHGPDDRRAHG